MTEAVHSHLLPEAGSKLRSQGALLCAEGLVKSFRSRKVVKGVSVEVRAGEVVGVITSYSIHYTKLYEGRSSAGSTGILRLR